jgi:hypothetical protein
LLCLLQQKKLFSAERDGYSEAEIHDEDPYFHKYIRPLTDNERMDWGLMFNEDVRLRQKFSTTVCCRQSSFNFQNLCARDSVMIDLSAYKNSLILVVFEGSSSTYQCGRLRERLNN